MGAISSLSRGVNVLTDSPAILGIAAAYAFVTGIVSLVQQMGIPVVSLLAAVLSFGISIFAFPFVLGGLVGMANETFAGGSSVSTFVDAGTDNYVGLLSLTLLLAFVLFVWGIVLFFVVFVVLVVLSLLFSGFLFGLGGVSSVGGMGTIGSGTAVVFAAIGIAFALLWLIPVFLLQFAPGAIVIEDQGFGDAIKRSLSVLRNDVVSVAGFDAVVLALGLSSSAIGLAVLVGLGGGLQVVMGSGSPPFVALLGQTFVNVVLGTVVVAFQWSYYTAFYRDVRDVTDADAGVASGEEWRDVSGAGR